MRIVGLVLAAVSIVLPATARGDLVRCKEVRAQARRAGITLPGTPARMVRQLNSRKPVRADLAYCRLAKLGGRAIDPLLRNTGATAIFAGSAWVHPSSSVVIGPPSQGLVSLYLVEAILAGGAGERRLAPRLLPRLIRDGVKDQAVLLADAAGAYRRWWAANRTTRLDELRAAGAHPLRDSPIDWL